MQTVSGSCPGVEKMSVSSRRPSQATPLQQIERTQQFSDSPKLAMSLYEAELTSCKSISSVQKERKLIYKRRLPSFS